MRNLYLFGEIDELAAHNIIEEIWEFNREDDEAEKTIDNCRRPPINIIINSTGGLVYDGFAIIDTMRESKTPIHTHAIGSCMSMAFMIYLFGDHRSCGKHTTFMHHESSIGLEGTTTCISRELENIQYLDSVAEDIILERTLITTGMLDVWSRECRDQYFNSDVAYNYGICHEIR